MNKGIIYLIQPAELVGTERYKIGMSNNPNLDRCKNGYKNGSRYICIMECNEPSILEGNIKNIFNKKFKLIAGNEYYEGNEKDILNAFNILVMEYNNSFVINKDRCLNNVIDDDVSEDDIDINQIREEFENYKEDIEYGGTKKLIKVYIIKRLHNIEIDNYRIELKYISDKNLQKDVLYVCGDIDDGDYYSSKYLKK